MKELDKRKNIGDLLIEYGKITGDDLREALHLQKEYRLRLGETLIKLGKVTKDDIEWVLSKQLDIPFVIVENINIDPKLVGRFSEGLLLPNRILPLYETDDEIAIATDEPLNKEVFDMMEDVAKKRIRLSSGNGEKIREILTRFFKGEGIPALINSIKDAMEKLTGTSFYRIDFIMNESHCEINAFGFGILRNIEVLNQSYTTEQVLEAFESTGTGFLYDDWANHRKCILSVIPLFNRIDRLCLPAAVGAFGLYLPDSVAFSDMKVSRVPSLFSRERPLPGYIYISTRPASSFYQQTVFSIDSAPWDCNTLHVHAPVPEICGACGGKGCEECRGLGYVFEKRMHGVYPSHEIMNIVKEIAACRK